MSRNGVPGIFSLTRRMRAHGSSFSSRTHFLKKAEAMISMPRKPASSICEATGRIMSVRMPMAHRLDGPSRSVVSTKWISFMAGSI